MCTQRCTHVRWSNVGCTYLVRNAMYNNRRLETYTDVELMRIFSTTNSGDLKDKISRVIATRTGDAHNSVMHQSYIDDHAVLMYMGDEDTPVYHVYVYDATGVTNGDLVVRWCLTHMGVVVEVDELATDTCGSRYATVMLDAVAPTHLHAMRDATERYLGNVVEMYYTTIATIERTKVARAYMHRMLECMLQCPMVTPRREHQVVVEQLRQEMVEATQSVVFDPVTLPPIVPREQAPVIRGILELYVYGKYIGDNANSSSSSPSRYVILDIANKHVYGGVLPSSNSYQSNLLAMWVMLKKFGYKDVKIHTMSRYIIRSFTGDLTRWYDSRTRNHHHRGMIVELLRMGAGIVKYT